MHICVGISYFAAFSSLYGQWDGLFGPGGLLPADSYADLVRNHFRTADFPWYKTYVKFPSLIVATSGFGSVEGLAHFAMILGMVGSAMIIFQRGPGFLWFLVCWASYMSLYVIGQTFLSFQWDILLLEVGFLCILTSSAPTSSPAPWLHRFLAWKLMFLSGCVKLQARCPTWEHLTALEFHFATQPLPTPLAWAAHQMSPTLLRIGVLVTLVVEIPLTFMLLLPNSNLRKAGAVLQIFLQVGIAATGNYNFFNFLTSALMLQVYSNEGTWDVANSFFTPVKTCIFTVACIYFSVVNMLDMTTLQQAIGAAYNNNNNNNNNNENGSLLWNGSALKLQDNLWTNKIGPVAGKLLTYAILLVLGQVLLAGYSGIVAVARELLQLGPSFTKNTSKVQRARRYTALLLKAFLRTLTICACFVMIPLSALSMSGVASSSLLNYQPVQSFARLVQPLHLSSGYGLFRQMTGVWSNQMLRNGKRWDYVPQVVARPEVVMEGLDATTLEWEPIHFKYKPGDLHEAPKWVAPHQPRLDWQMWFAALDTHQRNPWVLNLCYKLLTKDNEHIWKLLDMQKNAAQWSNGAAENRLPKQVRLIRWDYSFTFQDSPWARHPVPNPARTLVIADNASETEASQWWHRTNPVAYLDAVDAANPEVLNFLHQAKMSPRKYVTPAVQYKRCVLGLDFVHDAPRYMIRNTACAVLLLKPYAEKLCDMLDWRYSDTVLSENSEL